MLAFKFDKVFERCCSRQITTRPHKMHDNDKYAVSIHILMYEYRMVLTEVMVEVMFAHQKTFIKCILKKK